jgi:hypothetical protein
VQLDYGLEHLAGRVLPLESITMKMFIGLCLHARQSGRQTKGSTHPWSILPVSDSPGRHQLFFNSLKISGIQMESFPAEMGVDTIKHKVCVYGCKGSSIDKKPEVLGKRQHLSGTKYLSKSQS